MTNEQIQALKADAETSADNFKPEMVVDTKLIRSLLACLEAEQTINFFQQKRISELEGKQEADKALIDEQAKRIAELEKKYCGGALMEREEHHVGVVNKLLERIAELEARPLTVKLPESVIDAICLTAAEIHNLGRGVSDERAQEIINSIRCAAGITLVVGE